MLKMKSVVYEDDVTVVTINNAPADAGSLSSILGEIADAGVSLDMISQTAPTGGNINLSFTMKDSDFEKALRVIGSIRSVIKGSTCEVSSGNCKVAFTDPGMPAVCGVGAAILGIFSRAGVQIKLVTTSADTVSILFDRYSLTELREEVERSVTIY